MRSLVRFTLSLVFVCLFVVGVMSSTPVSAWCEKWPHHDCKQASGVDTLLVSVATVVRIVFSFRP
jgi:hypothetical protein